MTKLRSLTAKDLEKILFALGFQKIRQKGSHAFYKHAGRITTIPHHPGRTLSKPLLNSILKDIKLTAKDLEGL